MKDMRSKGRSQRGVRHHAAKFTEEDILLIRKLAGEGETHQSIADRYDVKRQAISKIIRKERGSHI